MAKNTKEKKSKLPMRWLMLVGVVLLIYIVIGFYNFQRLQHQILFEVVRLPGWFGKPSGYFIDSSGKVYEFDRNKPLNSLCKVNELYFLMSKESEPPYTTSDLYDYYGCFSTYSHAIPREELEQKVNLVDGLNPEEFVSYDAQMRDFGITYYTALKFDPQSRTYSREIVQYWGDLSGWSNTTEGEILGCWLEEIVYGSSDCSIRQNIIDRYEQIQSWEED